MTVFSSSSDDCNVLVHVRLMDSEFRDTCPHHSPVILVLSLRVFQMPSCFFFTWVYYRKSATSIMQYAHICGLLTVVLD